MKTQRRPGADGGYTASPRRPNADLTTRHNLVTVIGAYYLSAKQGLMWIVVTLTLCAYHELWHLPRLSGAAW